MRWSIMGALAIGLLVGLATAAQAQPADTILINGKIVTVDDRFTHRGGARDPRRPHRRRRQRCRYREAQGAADADHRSQSAAP